MDPGPSLPRAPIVADRRRFLLVWASVGLFCAALLPRIWLHLAYPTTPVSDFAAVVLFAQAFAAQGPAAGGWYWDLINPGTPMALAPLLYLLPGEDGAVAALATAIAMSVVPLLPLVLLRRAVPAWAAMLTGTLIALHPAHIVFSGVVAQDNWVQLPVVALACLAIRNSRLKGAGMPIAAAILLWSAYAFRQEMVLVCLPLAMLAAWPHGASRSRRRNMLLLAGVSAALLIVSAVQRDAATGRFALTSSHGGAAMLGSYVPGAGFGWIPYDDYVARVAPELSGDAERVREHASTLAIEEIGKRPLFHAVRRFGALLSTATDQDATLSYWSLQGEGVQAPAVATAAGVLGSRLHPWIVLAFVMIHALFLAALPFGIRRCDPAVLALAAAIALKVGLHLVFATQARFFLVVLCLEALVIMVTVTNIGRARKPLFAFAAVALLGGSVIYVAVSRIPAWEAEVKQQEFGEDAIAVAAGVPREVELRAAGALATCVLHAGNMVAVDAAGATFQVEHADPLPGETADLHCRISGPVPVLFQVEDAYAPGGFPDRMFQDVSIDGAQVRSHDIAGDAGSGWWSSELPLQGGRTIEVVVTIRALRPDPGPAWGRAAVTRVRLVEVPRP